IYNLVIHADEVRCGQPQLKNPTGSYAWLGNNPGNLTGVPGGVDIGQYAGKFNGTPPAPQGFLIFPTQDAGYDGIRRWLEKNGWAGTRYIDMSIKDAWLHYDAADAVRYTKRITDALGVSETTVLNTLTDDQWKTLKEAIRQAEGTLVGWTYG